MPPIPPTDHRAEAEAEVQGDGVVVVGLGPVGAVAAYALSRRGLAVTVLEAAKSPARDLADSRASTFHPPTLELLDDLGLFDDLYATGLVSPTYQLRDRTEGVIADFDLALLADDTRFPFRLQSEQQNLVDIVTRRLTDDPGVQVEYDAPVVAVDIDGDSVVLTIAGARPRSLRTRWVIAADGASSGVRKALAVDFPGLTYPERFLVVSTTAPVHELLPGIAHVNYVSDANEWLALIRTPRHWRALFPTAPDEEVSLLLAPEAVQARMQSISRRPEGYDIAHTSLYQVHQRVAADFRHGPLLLAGDAAHINNPLGGMGMNSGIHDALAAVDAIISADTTGDTTALDRYAAVRREQALEVVQKATHRNWQQLQERDPEVRAKENDKMRALAADPVQARRYLLASSMITSVRASTAALRA